jgi:hypothetical protein
MSVAANLLDGIYNSISNGKLIACLCEPGPFPPSLENTTQRIQFEISGENIVFELCVEDVNDKKSILCSTMATDKSIHFFRTTDYNITPKEVLELFGLATYPFKITYCEDEDFDQTTYMTTPVHSIPLSQFELYVPKN